MSREFEAEERRTSGRKCENIDRYITNGKFAFSWRILQLVLAVAILVEAVVRTRMLALLVFSLGQPAQPASQLLSLTHKFEARAPDLAKALVRRRDPRPPSNQRPLVFFHLRKSGGSQMRDALRDATRSLNLSSFIPCYDRVPCESYTPPRQMIHNRTATGSPRYAILAGYHVNESGHCTAGPARTQASGWPRLPGVLWRRAWGLGRALAQATGRGSWPGLSQLAWAIQLARGLRQLVPELVRRGTCSTLASRSGCGPARSSAEHAWPRLGLVLGLGLGLGF